MHCTWPSRCFLLKTSHIVASSITFTCQRSFSSYSSPKTLYWLNRCYFMDFGGQTHKLILHNNLIFFSVSHLFLSLLCSLALVWWFCLVFYILYHHPQHFVLPCVSETWSTIIQCHIWTSLTFSCTFLVFLILPCPWAPFPMFCSFISIQITLLTLSISYILFYPFIFFTVNTISHRYFMISTLVYILYYHNSIWMSLTLDDFSYLSMCADYLTCT